MIIYTDMVADIFHRGHVEFLKRVRCRYPSDYLIIGIHSDEVVASYKRPPIFSMEDRVEIISNTIFPDEVISFAPIPISKEFIEKYKIDRVAYAACDGEYTEYQKEVVFKYPIEIGIMRAFPYYDGISTTIIIERILEQNFGNDS